MNFKTTIILAVLLALAAGGLYYVKKNPTPTEATTIKPAPVTPPGVKKLIDKELGDVRKVVAQRHGQEPWVFEKKAIKEGEAPTKWVMTSPKTFNANSGDVLGLINRTKDLQYEIAYKSGQAGAVTPNTAGLEPAEATVSLTDDKGATVDVEFGKAVTDQTTYARLKGSNEIIVGKTNSKTLMKNKTSEWRDMLLWTFKPDQATRLEITDRSQPGTPANYVLSKADGKWMFESPVAARTSTKVDDMVRMLGSLRVSQWVDDRADKLASYGLEPATWSIKATVVEENPVAKTEDKPAEGENAEPEKPKTEKKETVYTVDVSDRSPIGEETKAYVRAGDGAAVGTLMKATADKLKPVMNEWRDMRITSASVLGATRIEITAADGAATLVKKDGAWTFEGDGARAEDTAVNDLLKAIGDLKAVSYADGEKIDASKLGWTKPQADIRLTIPTSEQPERITIGSFTDESTKLLAYARRNEGDPVAKVRAGDVANLARGVAAYRDRTIFNLTAGKIEQLNLALDSKSSGTPLAFELTKADDKWSMTAPTAANVREDAVTKLVDTLTTLKAQAVVDEKGQASAFGLDHPQATIKLQYKPPVEYKIEPAKVEGDEAPKNVSIEVQPPSQNFDLKVTQNDGKYYAQRGDRPAIYEVSAELYNQIFAELRSNDVLTFDDTKVKEFSIRDGDKTHAFEKKDGKWRYKTESDLPLDSKKIQGLLTQLKDLHTDRYVAYDKGDAGKFGLQPAAREVSVVQEDGTKQTLFVSSHTSDDGGKGNYASVEGRNGVFVLSPDATKRFQVNLHDLE